VIRSPLFPAVAAVAALFILSPVLFAGPGRNGTFLLFSGQALDFERDLAASRTLWHFDKAFFVPRFGRDVALSVGIGGKQRGGTWELSFLYAGQNVSLEDGDRRASFQALELNGRSFFLKKSFFHPYFLGGISLPFIRVRGGASYEGGVFDASYFGAGLIVGAGLLFEIGPSIILNAGALFRWIGFLYAYGGGKGRDINNLRVEWMGPEFGRLLRTDTVTLTIGLGFVL
jgi:hypothetical protein